MARSISPSPRRRRKLIVISLAVATLAFACGGIARGAVGGGGLETPKPPVVKDLTCIDQCADLREVAAGGKVLFSGQHLSNVDTVRFKGKGGKLNVKPSDVSGREVQVKVPDDAVDGKPSLIDSSDQVAKSPFALQIVSADQLPAPGEFKLADASVSPSKVFFDGDKSLELRYLFNSDSAQDIRIDLLKGKGGSVVRSWVQKNQQPASFNTLEWDGTTNGKRSAKAGDYRFRIGPLGGSGGSGGEGQTSFGYFDYEFPVRGKHNFGGAGAGFGAGRAGHTHQGQDVLSNCGTPIVAARGGKIQNKAFQSAAGNYVVIDGKGTGRDFMYAHLKKPASVKKGENVKTGEQIGIVGQTGDATACHLHFEMWSPPGWYQGGKPFDPLPSLKDWDHWS